MDRAQREGLTAEIAAIIGDQRDAIVGSVRSAIRTHIGAKSSKECLALVLRNANGDVVDRLPLAAEKRYASALIAFVRKQPFEGRTLDSGLTDSTAVVVADAFAAHIGEKSDAIAEKLMPLMISDERFVGALSAAMMSAYSGPVPRHLQKKVVSVLTAKLGGVLSQTIDTTTTATIKASLVKLAAASMSSPIAVKIASLLVASLTTTLKPIIVKLLASTAFKAAVVSKLKAVIVGSMLGAFVKIIGVKLGLTTAGAFLWVLIPLVLAWIAYEVTHFNEKLAAKVSDSVADDLADDFSRTSRSLADTVVEQLVLGGAGLLAGKLVVDENVIDLIHESIRDAELA